MLPNYGLTADGDAGGLGAPALALDAARLPELTVKLNWAYRKFDHLFGTFTYLGKPVYGFRSTPAGEPLDTFGRNLYVDTFNSAYGAGLEAREQLPHAQGHGHLLLRLLPARQPRPAGKGQRYRATIIGPGVTPDVFWEGARSAPTTRRCDLALHQEQKSLYGGSSEPSARRSDPVRPRVGSLAVVGEDLRAVMRRFPTGVAVVTVDAGGVQVGLTVASLVSLSLEPPLVGVSVSRQAALHELLRDSGSFAASLLAAGQEPLAQHFARGVPPIAMWAGVEVEPGDGPPLLAGAVGWLGAASRARRPPGPHVLRRRGRCRARRSGEPAAPAPGRSVPLAVIDAVVFDLDGVLLDSEQVWDEVREQLARERGGSWHERRAADMMGMSSPEWSRYMHDELGLARARPRRSTPRSSGGMLERYRERLPLVPGAVEAVRRLAARWPLGLASSSNRPLIDAVLDAAGVGRLRGDGLVGGGRARQARAGRLPRGGDAGSAWRRPLRGDRGLGERHPVGRTPPAWWSSRRPTPTTRRPPTRSPWRDVVVRSLDELTPELLERRVAALVDAPEQDAAVVAAEAHRVRERDLDLGRRAPRSGRSRGRTPDRGSGS